MIRIPFKKDMFNHIRIEFSSMLKRQLAQGNNGLTKTKYLTFGIEADSMKQAKGDALVTVVPERIQSPSLTADWEEKLLEIEHGNYNPETFMAEISSMITGLVRNYEAVKGADTLLPSREKSGKIIGRCPSCGSDIAEMQKGWFCTNKSCRFAIWRDNNYFKKLGKKMTPQLAEQLIRKGSAPLKNCRSERTGKTYNATVVVTPGQNGEAVFSLQFDKGGKA